uniref:30S ribosomal protein S3 n=1 Tax=Ascoseira mirabilis TaxID=76830 RepID=UPI00300361B2|nr:30S ribosomal protein S3 [Ascoseira mirabilis]
MGHKTHPLGFRLGLIQEDRSLWYSRANSYIHLLKQDYQIREYICQFLTENKVPLAGITKMLIQRDQKKKKVYVEIQSVVPGRIIGNSGALLKILDQKLRQLITDNIVLLNIVEIKNSYIEAPILVDVIIHKLERRVTFRKCIRDTIQRYKVETDLKGIKVQISGRLNGAEIARTEWVREGRVPLQTIQANIDYSYKTAQTTYGILGVKIWLLKNEILAKNII